MNLENVPVKYQMNIWKSLPKYPTKFDVLYEIYSFLLKNGKSEFSEQTLNGVWCDAKGVANWRGTKHEECYQLLVDTGFIKQAKSTNGKEWYIIDENKNPFL